VTLLANAVLTGLAVGAVYGLVAVAYSVIYTATRVFNLAQGDLVMVGVLLSYYCLDVQHWPQIVDLLIVMTGVTAVSLVEERTVVRPFLRRPSSNIGWFITTLAFGLVIETVAVILYGNQPPLPVPSPLGSQPLRIGAIGLSQPLALALVALVAITVGVDYMYRRTWLGQALRATSEDREVAALRGISPVRMSRLAFLIGGLIAGVSGYVVAPIVFANVSIGLNYSVFGFVALAIGGFGSTRGALVGSLALGVAQQVFDLYADARFEAVVPLILLLVILAIRPLGLFGDRQMRSV
jgi:branched-chain amino acid transport system permease protein